METLHSMQTAFEIWAGHFPTLILWQNATNRKQATVARSKCYCKRPRNRPSVRFLDWWWSRAKSGRPVRITQHIYIQDPSLIVFFSPLLRVKGLWSWPAHCKRGCETEHFIYYVLVDCGRNDFVNWTWSMAKPTAIQVVKTPIEYKRLLASPFGMDYGLWLDRHSNNSWISSSSCL